jgi:hypothetical protein
MIAQSHNMTGDRMANHRKEDKRTGPLTNADKTLQPKDIGAQGKREWSRQDPKTGQPSSKGTRRG